MTKIATLLFTSMEEDTGSAASVTFKPRAAARLTPSPAAVDCRLFASMVVFALPATAGSIRTVYVSVRTDCSPRFPRVVSCRRCSPSSSMVSSHSLSNCSSLVSSSEIDSTGTPYVAARCCRKAVSFTALESDAVRLIVCCTTGCCSCVTALCCTTCCPPITPTGWLPGTAFSVSKARPAQNPHPGHAMGRALPVGV